METKNINWKKLDQAVKKYGSLEAANTQREKDGLALEEKNAKIKQENDAASTTLNELASQIQHMNSEFKSGEEKLQFLRKQIKEHDRQYSLFCGFMAMVAESPSVSDSLDTLINSFQKLKEPGWSLPKSAGEMRGIFVQNVMGDYLKSLRCDWCGNKFITSKKPKSKFLSDGYLCPVCHYWYGLKEDDSFLKAMISEKQVENVVRTEELMKENDRLQPFKDFLNVPCEICNQPVTEWDAYSVKLAIQGIGCGHSRCWKSELGRMMEAAIALKKFKNK